MSEEIRDFLKKLVDSNMDHLVMQLAMGLKNIDKIALEAGEKGLNVDKPKASGEIEEKYIRDLAFEIFAEHKCGGRHHWLVIRNKCKVVDEEAQITVRCYACKLEKTVKIPAEKFRQLESMGYNELYRYVLSLIKPTL